MLDEVRAGNPDVSSFYRLLALCHTVMPEYSPGETLTGPWLIELCLQPQFVCRSVWHTD
jgi:hypothetical protein